MLIVVGLPISLLGRARPCSARDARGSRGAAGDGRRRSSRRHLRRAAHDRQRGAQSARGAHDARRTAPGRRQGRGGRDAAELARVAIVSEDDAPNGGEEGAATGALERKRRRRRRVLVPLVFVLPLVLLAGGASTCGGASSSIPRVPPEPRSPSPFAKGWGVRDIAKELSRAQGDRFELRVQRVRAHRRTTGRSPRASTTCASNLGVEAAVRDARTGSGHHLRHPARPAGPLALARSRSRSRSRCPGSRPRSSSRSRESDAGALEVRAEGRPHARRTAVPRHVSSSRRTTARSTSCARW